MNCINLPEFRVIKAEENEFDYRFTVETIDEPDFCPQCFYSTDSPRHDGKPFIKHGIKDREVWDLDMHGKRVKLVIKHRRYKCPVCGGTFYELLNSVAPNAKITTRLYYGTYFKQIMKHYDGQKYIILITDNESADNLERAWMMAKNKPEGAKLIVWKLVDNRIKTSNDPSVTHVFGFSDGVLGLIKGVIENKVGQVSEIKKIEI